jgi:hypothetical protein
MSRYFNDSVCLWLVKHSQVILPLLRTMIQNVNSRFLPKKKLDKFVSNRNYKQVLLYIFVDYQEPMRKRLFHQKFLPRTYCRHFTFIIFCYISEIQDFFYVLSHVAKMCCVQMSFFVVEAKIELSTFYCIVHRCYQVSDPTHLLCQECVAHFLIVQHGVC